MDRIDFFIFLVFTFVTFFYFSLHNGYFPFLDASKHLYKRVRPSIVRSVGHAFFNRGNRPEMLGKHHAIDSAQLIPSFIYSDASFFGSNLFLEKLDSVQPKLLPFLHQVLI